MSSSSATTPACVPPRTGSTTWRTATSAKRSPARDPTRGGVKSELEFEFDGVDEDEDEDEEDVEEVEDADDEEGDGPPRKKPRYT